MRPRARRGCEAAGGSRYVLSNLTVKGRKLKASMMQTLPKNVALFQNVSLTADTLTGRINELSHGIFCCEISHMPPPLGGKHTASGPQVI